MLLLDSEQVQYCQVTGQIDEQQQTVSGLIYNGNIFIKAQSFDIEELQTAIKECREQYLDHEERSQIPTLLVKGEKTVDIWMQDNRYKPDSTALPEKKTSESKSSSGNLNRISVRQVAAQMRSPKGVSIKTRRYKLKLYQRCFLGNEAVDWMVEHLKISRSEAVQIGQKMIDKNLVHHIVDDHEFRDEPIFYRFYEDEGKSIWTDKIV